jgi:hypothetical protein
MMMLEVKFSTAMFLVPETDDKSFVSGGELNLPQTAVLQISRENGFEV